MRTIRPELDTLIITVAEKQEEYETVQAALVAHPQFDTMSRRISPDSDERAAFNTHLYAFVPDDEQKARVAAGEALYIGLLTFGFSPQPILVLVGKEEAAQVYGVAAT